MFAIFALITVVLSTVFMIVEPEQKPLETRKVQTIHVETLKRYENKSFPVKLTIDGKKGYNNKFSPYPYADFNYPIPVYYDLKFVYSLNEIHLYNDGPGNSVRQFRIMYSTDNRQFHHLYTSDTLKDLNYDEKLCFATVKARYIRVDILKAYGDWPEFREITFFAEKPIVQMKASKKKKKNQFDYSDSVLVKEFSPDKHKLKGIDIKEQKDNRYFYSDQSMKIIVTNQKHDFIEFSFYESEKINREMRLTIPEINYSTNIEVFANDYSMHYIHFAEHNYPRKKPYTIILENMAGPNAFFNRISFYQKVKKRKRSTSEIINAYQIDNQVDFFKLKNEKHFQNIFKRTRRDHLSLLYNDKHVYMSLKIPFDRIQNPDSAILNFIISFDSSSVARYNNQIYHFSIPLIEPGDGRPIVDIVQHIGQSFNDRDNILNNSYYSNFQGYISITNNIEVILQIPFPIVSLNNKQISVNYIINSTNMASPLFLSSLSTSPEYLNPVELKPSIIKSIASRDRYFLNEKMSIQISDQLANQDFKKKEYIQAQINKKNKLQFEETTPNSGIYTAEFLVPSSYAQKDLHINYHQVNKKISILAGYDAQLKVLDQKSRKKVGKLKFKENESILISINDKDVNKDKKKVEKIVSQIRYQFDDPITKKRSQVKSKLTFEENSDNSSDFDSVFKLPKINSLNKNINEYEVEIIYSDPLTSQGYLRKGNLLRSIRKIKS
jgi:hypothetical protein